MKPRTVTLVLEVESDLSSLLIERALKSNRLAADVLMFYQRGTVFKVRQVSAQVVDATKKRGGRS